jgi:N-acetylglucosamine-6-phosphate deacetylase
MICDLQVNGFIGVDFSSPTLTEESFREACHALIQRGTTVFLPTMITSPESLYGRNLSLMRKVLEQDEALARHVPGFHLEGPFISPASGAVGAHNPAAVSTPDCALFDRLINYAGGRIKLLTMAAELPGADTLVQHAIAKGVAISCGHHLATATDLSRMVEAGAVALTHLGNGVPNLLHRHNNPILAGLGETRMKIMFIPDGHHLPTDFLRMLASLIPVSRLIATSDASPAAGLPPGRYNVLGNDVVLEPNGRLHNPDKNCLVGSSATLSECVEVLRGLHCFTEAQLETITWENPMNLIGMFS